jgi:hypothetical protein
MKVYFIMKKKIICVAILVVITSVIFAQAGAVSGTIYDGSITPPPEWVQHKMLRNERPAYIGVFIDAGTLWQREVKHILDNDKFAWCYADDNENEVYIFAYSYELGENLFALYVNN